MLNKKVKNGPQEVDILHWMSRTALELIGQSGMGYSFDPLVDDHQSHPYMNSVKGLACVAQLIFVMRFLIVNSIELSLEVHSAFLPTNLSFHLP